MMKLKMSKSNEKKYIISSSRRLRIIELANFLKLKIALEQYTDKIESKKIREGGSRKINNLLWVLYLIYEFAVNTCGVY